MSFTQDSEFIALKLFSSFSQNLELRWVCLDTYSTMKVFK